MNGDKPGKWGSLVVAVISGAVMLRIAWMTAVGILNDPTVLNVSLGIVFVLPFAFVWFWESKFEFTKYAMTLVIILGLIRVYFEFFELHAVPRSPYSRD